MTEQDARFEDAGEPPLRLRAVDMDDLRVISALVQDSVFAAGDVSWCGDRREFALLLNRFRWEDKELAERLRHDYERVRSVLLIKDVMNVVDGGTSGTDRGNIFALLEVGFEPGEDGTGTITLILAGDQDIVLEVECIDVTLTDVTRPHRAVSRNAPGHD